MFCVNCGKQISDAARFCNYCGARVVDSDEKAVENSPIFSENSVSVPDDNVYNTENVENSVDLLKMYSSVSGSIPQMNEPIKSGEAPFSANAAPADIRGGAVGAQRGESPVPSEIPAPRKEPAERRYTIGHIIMCLVSTAVMAIVAGVFAGLYFSVV